MIQRLRADIDKSEEGFTLVELLVVIVILGILAAIVVFAVGGITDKGTTAANQTDSSVLSAGEEANFAQKSLYGTVQTLEANGFLRTASTKSYLCIQSNVVGTVGVNMDYYVVSGRRSGNAALNAGCVTQAALQTPAKPPTATWTASNGSATFP
jgi:prepilin-type N-terminal cleavage/methylation domain-containing protein